MVPFSFSKAAAAVTNAASEIARWLADGRTAWTMVQVKNVGATALNSFKIQRRAIAGGDWIDWISGTDFDTATTVLRPSVVSPVTLAGGAATWFDVDLRGCAEVRFVATVGSGNTTVDLNATGAQG